MQVKKFLHTRMRVSDMEQTLAFYQSLFELEIVAQSVSPRGSQLAFLSVPNSNERIELCCFPSSGPVKVGEDLVHLAFEVEDMNATIDALKTNNILITDGPTATPTGERFLFIDDPDGYELELIQRPITSKSTVI